MRVSQSFDPISGASKNVSENKNEFKNQNTQSLTNADTSINLTVNVNQNNDIGTPQLYNNNFRPQKLGFLFFFVFLF